MSAIIMDGAALAKRIKADIRERMNRCPLGAGALAGTTYPLDRDYSARLLGFAGPTLNSMDSVADRDLCQR